MSYRFANGIELHWLWLLPVIVAVTWLSWSQQKQSLKKMIEARLLPLLTQSVSAPRRHLKLALECLAFLFFVLALGRPQSGQTREKVKSEGVELVLVVDVSQSMLAEDTRPSRLELAKRELGRLIDMSTGDRIGLIAFAGSSILLSPLTTDHGALKMYLESLSPASVSTQGTEFRKALQEAQAAFQRGGVEGGENSVTTRAIVIASDGEDQEPGANEAARQLVDAGIRIFTLGFGSEKGGPIPLRDDHNNLSGYLKDAQGQVVLTQTKGTVLKELAVAGRGSYYQVNFGGDAIPRLFQDVARLEKTTFDSAEMTNFNERFQLFLLIGCLLALLELLLSERKAKAGPWRGRFEVGS